MNVFSNLLQLPFVYTNKVIYLDIIFVHKQGKFMIKTRRAICCKAIETKPNLVSLDTEIANMKGKYEETNVSTQ